MLFTGKQSGLKFTGMKEPNDISTVIDWILTEKCNLNCYYCLQNADTRNARCEAIDYSFIHDLSSRYLFHLTGGEPFLVPNLNGLCNSLQEAGQYVSMNTNLTLPVERFTTEVKNDRFLFINSSVHYPYRKMHMKPFLQNYRNLKASGFFIYATVVMLPGLVEELLEFIGRYQKEDIFILPKLMRGIDCGRSYPRAYTPDQRSRMQDAAAATILKMTPGEQDAFRIACRYNVSIDNWGNNPPDIDGTRCFDGNRFIRITETGDITYCNNQVLGHISGGFKTLGKSNTCKHSVNNLCLKSV